MPLRLTARAERSERRERREAAPDVRQHATLREASDNHPVADGRYATTREAQASALSSHSRTGAAARLCVTIQATYSGEAGSAAGTFG